MKFNAALFLATAGSLVAAQGAHRHGHRHLHRRDAATAVATDVVYVYQLDGKEVSANEVCEGVKSGKYLWADGTAPAGACSTASATPTPSSSAVDGPAEFFETPSSTPTPSSSALTSSSTSSTFTSSSTISVSSSTTTSSTSTSSAWTSSSVASSSVATPSPSPSSTPSGLNGGGVNIVNEVGQTIYLWSTSEDAGHMRTLPAGESYSETWKLNPDQGGISIKISTTPDEADVMQFEYTLLTPIIWWDVSLINMEITSLFDKLGFSVTSDNSQCYTVNCPAGDTSCNDAYLWPTDDQATHSCDSTTQMTLHLGKPLLSGL
ncbi:conserved hypothetical protein [Paecilomyces variotii No. 5]|uniref:Uncharacterized protein n=1 Tax=Byssochlamys spectabilis (strain No. 5 / NBRC 109023) TaxID=1356009 RepID=V5FY10_BYSSN|nr:conserved hypothetical protein [Paecilomyces variotii No. 5]